MSIKNYDLNNEFIKSIKTNFEEWHSEGSCREAKKLNEKVKNGDFNTKNPQFFTGDLNANLVLVHLNPKLDNEEYCFSSFEEYMNFYTKFGKNKYREGTDGKHTQFDCKQIRFLRPFNLLCINNEDESKNLENVIDQKLQLELVPFASSSFKYKKSDICSFDPYMERILKFLTQSQKRDYIIFCSRIFEQLLKNYVIDSNSFKFKFEKVDSTKSKLCYEIINLKIKFDNKELICAIAPQFAMQGCPVGNYGQMIKECYGRFEELNERKEFSPYLCNKTVQKWQKN